MSANLATFMLTILGTLLTRSGVVSSVHAFAQSAIGTWFWVFLVIVFAGCLFTFILQRDHLKSEHKLESLISANRASSSTILSYWLLVSPYCGARCFPSSRSMCRERKSQSVHLSTIAWQYQSGCFCSFSRASVLCFAWRSSSFRSIRKNFVLPTAAGILTAIVLVSLW